MQLNVNLDAVVRHTATLERLRKSALPSAIRGALNDCAFDVKMKTMPARANSQFINRSPNFFKANSTVVKATGFDVNSMKSQVGFIEDRLRSDSGKPKSNFAVRDLQQQNYSGTIGGRSFIPMDTARRGNVHTGLVLPKNRIARIMEKGYISANKQTLGIGSPGQSLRRIKGKKEQFNIAVRKAGVGGYVLGSDKSGENILWRVDEIYLHDSGRHSFDLTPLYDYVKKRKPHIKPTMFMTTATNESAVKMETFYLKQAEFWIKRYTK